MSKRSICRFLSPVICTLVFVSIAAAHEVKIKEMSNVGNGSQLQPGTYRVEVVKNQDSSEALFYEGGDLTVRVPVTITTAAKKAPYTEVHFVKLSDGMALTEIRLEGSKESLLFSQAATAKSN
jgi:hypothetical protein